MALEAVIEVFRSKAFTTQNRRKEKMENKDIDLLPQGNQYGM